MKTFVLMTVAVMAAAGSAMAIDVAAANADLKNGIQFANDVASARLGTYGDRAITAGDTYGAAVLGQTTAVAAFMTAAGRVTTFTYDNLASAHGTLVGSGAVVGMTEITIPTGPNSVRIIVDAFTVDGTDLWQTGITAGTPALPITQGRFDVGAGAFTNGLLWDNLPGAISSVSIFNAVFIDGVQVAASAPLTNGRVLPQMGSLVVWNGVVGSGVDETAMVFDITFIPTPGAMALVGMGGLMAARRRR